MSRDYISESDVSEDVAWSLRRIADALERTADLQERIVKAHEAEHPPVARPDEPALWAVPDGKA